MSEYAIELDNIELKLGKQQFSFDVKFRKGCVTAITGPSGSGKSTLLNLVSGFELAERGKISMIGQDVTDRLPAERPVSSIFQDHNLFAHLDVFTNVALGAAPDLRLSAAQRHVVQDALKRVGLEGFDKRLPAALSGGERQRAALARALVQDKPIILLDEPFAALDPSLRRDMGALILNLNSVGERTILLVTHQPDEVMRLADEVIFVESGKILFSGPVADFTRQTDLEPINRFLNA